MGVLKYTVLSILGAAGVIFPFEWHAFVFSQRGGDIIFSYIQLSPGDGIAFITGLLLYTVFLIPALVVLFLGLFFFLLAMKNFPQTF